MIKAIELEKWAEDIMPVIIDINISMKNIYIIEVESEKGNDLMEQGFFRYMLIQQKYILTIQLAKIFSNNKNQKRNFNTLCNRLENECLDEGIKKLLLENCPKCNMVFRKREDIIDAINKFRTNLGNHKATIDNVRNLRDKVYAHTDIMTSPPKIAPNKELKELVQLANEMYNTLFGQIFDRNFFFEDTGDWDLRYVIEGMSKNENR